MRIAILGATSQLAKDLIFSLHSKEGIECTLFSRDPEILNEWLIKNKLNIHKKVSPYSMFGTNESYQIIINFVGIGDPAKAKLMGSSILNITMEYDNLAMNYLEKNKNCKYIFISSGAVYGSDFSSPVNVDSQAIIPINSLQSQNWYAIAKLYAECRHRSRSDLSIVDIRVFNYFSHTQDMNARFLITDIFRAIRKKTLLRTSTQHIVRDYLHPSDFKKIILSIINTSQKNLAIDLYTKAPISKNDLLVKMKSEFGLNYAINETAININATGIKPYYFSQNEKAKEFGYQPEFTSLDGILIEMTKALKINYD